CVSTSLISFSSKISRLQIVAYVSVRISGGSSVFCRARLSLHEARGWALKNNQPKSEPHRRIGLVFYGRADRDFPAYKKSALAVPVFWAP
ncbi:hypothetical protein, partial [Allgaiera indica]